MQTTEKELALKALHDLPGDATLLDAMESLLVVHKIEKGLKQKAAGQTVSHEEAKKRFAKWLR